MTTVTRQQLLDLESDTLGELINLVPAELQDEIMAVMAGLAESVDIPSVYLEGLVDDL